MFELRLHPMFVDFPIALPFTSVLLDAAGEPGSNARTFVTESIGFLSSVLSEGCLLPLLAIGQRKLLKRRELPNR